MGKRTRIRLVGGGDVELCGEGLAATKAKAALEDALATLRRQVAARPSPPDAVQGASLLGKAALAWTPVVDATAYHVLRPATAGEAQYPQDAKYRTSEVSIIDDAVSTGVTYYYAVATESGDRNVSSPSEIVSIAITADPPVAAQSPGPWTPRPVIPPLALDWKPTIGAPAWGNLDVAEVSLRSLFDAQGSLLRPYVLASLDDAVPYQTALTEAVEYVTRHGSARPYVGLTLDGAAFGRDAASQRAFAGELGGLANDLGRFGVGLAIRVDT
jgi:hypothetical protein